ncbi:hypothetical protein J421_0560 [Gemmatirosa kalamazoonensis]|uniref:AB hydrolase-1 domain-containing protein n=1 Tax=Gemmatirosa kalamazoonensis TaxID=861299 RepID=W0RCC2_9BACT|nr:alpha/beta fold hydrolase [Gemmatirosa kalamazoonensis]AHG88097.1 hypothetical protein J421_0560 [Gemmatirosa kalamazoonensis]
MTGPVSFTERTVAGVPLLLAAPDDVAAPPLVLWHHGFSAAKESHRAELARVAALGFRAAGVDAVGHGARRFADWDARLAAARAGPPGSVFRFMLSIAAATADETPALVAALAAEGLADPARVSLVGISLGGYVAYRAVLRMPTLRAVVALLGSPVWPDDMESPHRRPDAFRDVALLSVTAERDASVPPEEARRFHDTLPDTMRARYVELAGAEHLVSGEDWARMMDETMGWLRTLWRPPVPRAKYSGCAPPSSCF